MTISHLHHLRRLTTHLREEAKDYSSSDADADSSEDESIEEVAEEIYDILHERVGNSSGQRREEESFAAAVVNRSKAFTRAANTTAAIATNIRTAAAAASNIQTMRWRRRQRRLTHRAAEDTVNIAHIDRSRMRCRRPEAEVIIIFI